MLRSIREPRETTIAVEVTQFSWKQGGTHDSSTLEGLISILLEKTGEYYYLLIFPTSLYSNFVLFLSNFSTSLHFHLIHGISNFFF